DWLPGTENVCGGCQFASSDGRTAACTTRLRNAIPAAQTATTRPPAPIATANSRGSSPDDGSVAIFCGCSHLPEPARRTAPHRLSASPVCPTCQSTTASPARLTANATPLPSPDVG